MDRIKVAILINNQPNLAVVILRAEAEIELIRHRAMQFEDVAVGVVDVLSGDHASFGDIADDVSVVVVAREIKHTVDRDSEKSTDTACTLFRAGEVVAPEVFAGAHCAVGERDGLQDDIVAVPYKVMCLRQLPFGPVVPLDGLADAVVPVIVGVLDGKGVFSRDNRTSRKQTVLRVEGVSETSVVGHVAIGVVGERNGRRDGGIAPYLRILVKVVGRVGVLLLLLQTRSHAKLT